MAKKKEEKRVRFEGGEALAWMHPIKEIDVDTVIMVPHTHEAIYVQEGALWSSFDPGAHKPAALSDHLSRKERKRAQKEFECSILYVNTQSSLQVLWGTPSRMDVFDPKINIPVSVGLSGSFAIKVNQPRQFVTKLGGLDAVYTKQHLQDFFKSIMLQYIKEALAYAMVIEKVSFYEIWNNTRKITDVIKSDLLNKFLSYGVELSEFAIDNIVIPDEIKKNVETVYKEKFLMESKGFTHRELYEDSKENVREHRDATKEVLKEFAKASNKNLSTNNNLSYCSNCGHKLSGSDKFCSKCGKKQ